MTDFKDIQEQYDEWAPTFEQDAHDWRYSTPEKLAERLSTFLDPGMKLVDLGCGTGLNGARYHGLVLFGADSSVKMLQKARERGYRVFQMDILNAGFLDNCFDVSVCTSVLEYYENIKPYLREMKRIVKPNGVITFTVACTEIEGLYHVHKRELDSIVAECTILPLQMFRILSHWEDCIEPKQFWVTIGRNLK